MSDTVVSSASAELGAFLSKESPEGNLRTSEVQGEGGRRPAEQTLGWEATLGMDSNLLAEGKPGRGEAWQRRPRRAGAGEGRPGRGEAQERGGPGEEAQERGGPGEGRPGRAGTGEQAQVLRSRVFIHVTQSPVTKLSHAPGLHHTYIRLHRPDVRKGLFAKLYILTCL